MEDSKEKQTSTSAFIRAIWPLLLAALGVAMTWGVYSARYESLERRVTVLERRADESDAKIGAWVAEASGRLATIEATTTNAYADIREIRALMQRQ